MNQEINFDLDAFEDEIQNAPVAGFGPRMTYGQMFINDIQIMAWKGDRESRKPNPRPFANGDKANKEKGEYLQITFEIDVQSINPKARAEGWTWTRKVDMKQSGGRALTDWSEVVLPSLVSVIGKDWAKKLQKGIWVEVEEPDTVVLDKATGRPKTWTTKPTDGSEPKTLTNTTIRILRVFRNKAECLAAFTERYTSKEASSDDEDEDDVDEKIKVIPGKIAKDFKGILTAYEDDENDPEVIELASEEPYDKYDYDALIAAARKK